MAGYQKLVIHFYAYPDNITSITYNKSEKERGDVMLFINYPSGQWREWDTNTMRAFNYRGGYCDVDENALGGIECLNLGSWHELYLIKHFCPLEAEKHDSDVWISPDGLYYNGEAHDVTAEYLLDIIYGEEVDFCAGDKLEDRGWIRACRGMMWPIRVRELEGKCLPRAQYNALWDYCKYHSIKFPEKMEIRFG